MPPRAFGTKPTIILDGDRLPVEIEPHLVEVVVETDLTAPGSCLVTFADPGRDVLDALGVDFLQRLEVLASPVEEVEEEPLFVGDVYGFDFMADETGTFALIRAYDATYKLKQRRGISSFCDVTDGDVVRTLAEDAGVETGTIDGGDVIHPYLAQVNQSHWDFLQRRAQASDCTLHVCDGRLAFTKSTEASDGPRPGDHASTDPLQLIAGHNLVYFRVRTTASQQVGAVEVRGWDPSRKETVVAEAEANSRSARLETTPAEIGTQHGTETRVAAFPGLTTQAACDVIATSVAERVAASFGYAEGQAIGDPRLRAGVAVSVGRTGRFDGQYTLTAARHVFGRAGYHTTFSVSGEHDRTLHGLSAGRGAPGTHRFDGVYPAIVTNVADPGSLGRVKLKLPWLADDYETDWARVMQIGAGPDRGILWFPEVDDEVLVAFIGGDPAAPAVIGGLYNGTDTPPFEGFADPEDGQVDTRCLQTRAGHALVFCDAEGEQSVRLHTGDASISITLDQARGTLVIESGGDVELRADGNVAITAGRDLTLEAAGTGTIRANAGLKLESAGSVAVSGATIQLN